MFWNTATCRSIDGALNIYLHYIYCTGGLNLYMLTDWKVLSLHLMFLIEFQITTRVLFNVAFSFILNFFFPKFWLYNSPEMFQTISAFKIWICSNANNAPVLCPGSHENIFQPFIFDQPLNQYSLSKNLPFISAKYLLFSQFLAHLILFPMLFDTSETFH